MPVQSVSERSISTSLSHIRVRFCETDLMGIVHHATYLVYFEAARVEWLRNRSIDYTTWLERGIHVPVAEARVKYLAPCRFDDQLEIETTLAALRTVSLDFTYRILRGPARIAEGFTRLACTNNEGKLLRIPEDIRVALLAGETVPAAPSANAMPDPR
jgi:acyl-CoA thioester hydrolase